MIVLDAYAVIALLNAERGGARVRELLRENDGAITTLNLAEVADQLIRVHRQPDQSVREVLASMAGDVLVPLDLTVDLALRGAQIRARHYHRTRSPVSMADCVCLAAVGPGDRVATADRAMLRAAAAEGLDAVELPRR